MQINFQFMFQPKKSQTLKQKYPCPSQKNWSVNYDILDYCLMHSTIEKVQGGLNSVYLNLGSE